MFTDPSFLLIGTQLSLKYKIIDHIGAGGCGKTYLVSNVLGVGEPLVVKEFYIAKMCNRDTATQKVSVSNENRESFENLRERFKKEAIKVSQLEHPNIVKVVDLFEANDTVYYVMNQVKGETLADKINRGERIDEARIMRYLNQLLNALEYIHSRKPVGIMHLDIKPANIMIDENDNVVLIDFGASKSFNSTSVNQTLMSTVGLLYTPGYAPIEQENGNVADLGSHCDLYALGATLFKIYTGQTPPKPYDIRKKGLPTIIGASPLMQKIIKKALEFDYDNRIKTVAEFRAMLSGDEPTVSDPTVPPNPVDPTITIPTPPPSPDPNPPMPPKPTPPSPPDPTPPNSFLEWICKYPILLWIYKRLLIFWICNKNIIKRIAIILLVVVAFVCAFVGVYHLMKVLSRQPTIQPTNNIVFTDTINGVTFNMVQVEGGTFTMGSTYLDAWIGDAYTDECPSHKVTLSDYYIGETEVTQALWEAVMNYEGLCADGAIIRKAFSVWLDQNPSTEYGLGANYPAYNVSYEDIVEVFIPRLNAITGKSYSLPTESEWEFAARGGNKSRGCEYSGSDNIGDVAWYTGNSSSRTHEVGTKSPNELGLYDMSGNVWEWCSDWYGSYSSSSQTNPTGPTSGSYRVLRGGGWYSFAQYCRVSYRHYYDPVNRDYSRGFRLALRP